MSDFIAFSIIIGIAAKETGFAPADFISLFIVMGVSTKDIGLASSFVCHSHNLQFSVTKQ